MDSTSPVHHGVKLEGLAYDYEGRTPLICFSYILLIFFYYIEVICFYYIEVICFYETYFVVLTTF